MKLELPDGTEVDVVMRKSMKYSEYKKMISQARKKGWQITAYQKGFAN